MLLIKNAQIIDKNVTQHGGKYDILISDGKIEKIAKILGEEI